MLRIRIELVPFGDLSSARTLEVVDVGNVGATTAGEALDPDGERNYVVLRRAPGTEETPLGDALDPDAAVTHRRADGYLKLAERALAALEGTVPPALLRSPPDESEGSRCDTCGARSTHWLELPAAVDYCCRCFVGAGNDPADFHADCMVAYQTRAK